MGFFDNKVITLFNCWIDPGTEEEKYYRTVLEHVDLVETKGANVSKSGMESADAVKLYIDLENIVKQYLPPKKWEALPEDQKSGYFTLTPAQDFFVKGNCTGATLPEEQLYEWMRNNFDDVYKVTTVDKYEDILPHFEVGGV